VGWATSHLGGHGGAGTELLPGGGRWGRSGQSGPINAFPGQSGPINAPRAEGFPQPSRSVQVPEQGLAIIPFAEY